ncbi:beta-1,4-galactosyltransferase 4-like [Pieris napi]|uniref:beta-1,4-galactosyltransferase 4-like n=1 Tax=Pieris napi TaxID=78633 RepID=UPI001FB8D0DC|nr:beta-1,4-galactosyltransferase 4-like [Pieris napi]
MSQTQYKSRRIVLVFVIAAILSFMYHTSYTINYIITNKNGGNFEMNNDLYINETEYSQLVPINIDWNKQVLRNTVICGKNITSENAKNVTNRELKDGLLDYFQNYENEKNELCPRIPPHLGPVPGDKSIIGLYGIENMHIDIVVGGIHSPSACIARQNAAIIVPLHETNKHMRKYLTSFLYYMHPFLMKQQLAYQIFVISKLNSTTPYKRGQLYNIGFEVAQTKRAEGWMCFIFHDPHIVPEDTRNLYRCGSRPKRLIADTRMPPRFGGAISIQPEKFTKANGFSNLAWNDDDDYIDMYRRLIVANISLETNKAPIGKYSSLPYLKQTNNITVRRKQTTPSLKKLNEGLNNIKLTIMSIEYHQLYTLVTIVE